MEDITGSLQPVAGGVTSDEIVKQALEHSPELRKALLSEDTAAANAARAKIAFAPRFDFSGKYTRLSRVNMPKFDFIGGIFPLLQPVYDEAGLTLPPAPAPQALFPQVLDQFYLQASAMLPVTDIFLTVIPTYKAAAKSLEVAKLRRQASELQVSHDARVAFYSYAHVIGAVLVAQKAVALLERNVADLESLVAAGTATQTDLIRAQAELGKARVRAVEISGMQEVALARLKAITGATVDGARPIGEALVGTQLSVTPSVADIESEAKRSRPEFLALKRLVDVRTLLTKARRNAQYPKLAPFANFVYANPNPRILPPEKEWNHSWDVGVMLSWSPNDSVYAHTQYKDSLIELKSVHEDLKLVEDGITVEAASAVASHRTAVAGVDAAQKSLEAAHRYQTDERALMLAGAATPNDVLQAQTQLTRAALDWVDAFINVRMAEAALLKAQGKTGLDAQAQTVRSSTP